MPVKKPKDSKVLKFNIGSILILAIAALSADPVFLEAVGYKGYIALMIAGAVVNAILRQYTVKPLATSKEGKELNALEQALLDEADENGMI